MKTAMRTESRRGWRFGMLAGTIMLTSLPHQVAARSAVQRCEASRPPAEGLGDEYRHRPDARRVQAGSDGSYVIVDLPPGTYRINAGPGTDAMSRSSSPRLRTSIWQLRRPRARSTRSWSAPCDDESGPRKSAPCPSSDRRTTPQITRNFLEFADTHLGRRRSEVDAKGNTSLHSGHAQYRNDQRRTSTASRPEELRARRAAFAGQGGR